jgi:hypothetical protein
MPYHSSGFTSSSKPITEAEYVFSFQGNATFPLRRRLSEAAVATSLRHSFVATHKYFEKMVPYEQERLRDRTRELFANSKFVLCPRGAGLSSIRFFDAMASGRIPVLIADHTKLPLQNCIDYENLIVRVPEQRLELLEESIIRFEQGHDLSIVSTNLVTTSEKYFTPKALRTFLEHALAGNAKPSVT